MIKGCMWQPSFSSSSEPREETPRVGSLAAVGSTPSLTRGRPVGRCCRSLGRVGLAGVHSVCALPHPGEAVGSTPSDAAVSYRRVGWLQCIRWCTGTRARVSWWGHRARYTEQALAAWLGAPGICAQVLRQSSGVSLSLLSVRI